MIRTFVLRDKAIADRACAYIQTLVGGDTLFAVTVSEAHGKRTLEQNDRLHRALRSIAEDAWMNGRQGSVDDWKAYLLLQGGFVDHYKDMTTGELRASPMPTSRMTVKQMSEFIEFVIRFAASNLGVEV